jgi:hypothetical protein
MDIINYLDQIEQERYRAVIIHSSPDQGIAITKFTKKVCQKRNGKFIDLLDMFIHSPELSGQIDCFGPDQLKDYLITQSKSVGLVVIDKADFIFDTWRRDELKAFLTMLIDQWDSYKDAMKSTVVLLLQTSLAITDFKQVQSFELPRINQLSDFIDI